MKGLFLIPAILPAIAGIFLVISSFMDHRRLTLESKGKENIPEENVKTVHLFSLVILGLSILGVLYMAWTGERSVTVLSFMKEMPIFFHVDDLSRFFVSIVSLIWFLAGIYAVTYMKHEGEEKRYFGFYLIVYSVLVLLGFAGNLTTMYFFYEMMTLTSMPLVFHNGSKAAIMASLKYLFYSMCGAYLAIYGIFFLFRYANLEFIPGGSVIAGGEHQTVFLIAIFCMILGFGAKAGMFPLHAWLPSAHPVAPSPASATLSAIIVKCGIFAIVRVIYYVVGPEYIRGTWVQYAWMILALLTVFMGSMLAYVEPVLKKRLAYSSVSQLSYILFGLSLLNQTAFTGAMMHVAYHAVIKSGLFLCAGVFMFCCHKTKVKDLVGVGRQMPVVLWCWTFFSLALIGIPPFSGFMSKWYLAQGALEGGVGVFGYIGPVILLISALLTAGYLLPITMKGFFPGEYHLGEALKEKPSLYMVIPLVILAALSLLMGVLPNPLIGFFGNIASAIM